MNMNITFVGIPERIIAGAIHTGLAKTKTDAIRLGLIELDHRYKLLEQLEDEEDIADSKRIEAEVKSGKQRTYSATEFEKKTGMKIT